MRRLGWTPIMSRTASASAFHTQALACSVVGLSSPASAKLNPDRALKSVDLPEPVPPASAATVTPMPARTRSSAEAISSLARAARKGSKKSPPWSIAPRSLSRRRMTPLIAEDLSSKVIVRYAAVCPGPYAVPV